MRSKVYLDEAAAVPFDSKALSGKWNFFPPLSDAVIRFQILDRKLYIRKLERRAKRHRNERSKLRKKINAVRAEIVALTLSCE